MQVLSVMVSLSLETLPPTVRAVSNQSYNIYIWVDTARTVGSCVSNDEETITSTNLHNHS